MKKMNIFKRLKEKYEKLFEEDNTEEKQMWLDYFKSDEWKGTFTKEERERYIEMLEKGEYDF